MQITSNIGCLQERLVDGAAALGLLGRQDLAAADAVAAVLEAPQLFDLMRGLMHQVPLSEGMLLRKRLHKCHLHRHYALCMDMDVRKRRCLVRPLSLSCVRECGLNGFRTKRSGPSQTLSNLCTQDFIVVASFFLCWPASSEAVICPQCEAGAQDGEVVTSGYKWLRAVARGEFTGLHCDRVFLGRGSRALLTAWLPLGRVPTGRGSLLVARGSHRLRAFNELHSGYGTSEVGTANSRRWLSELVSDVASPLV